MLTLLLATALAADRRTPVVEAVEKATPAVVTLEVEVAAQNPFALFGGGPATSESQGSGVIIDKSGIVLTNAHVVDGALSITVHDKAGRSWPANVLAMEPTIDLAVLSLEGAKDLPTLPLGDSEALLLGETVIAIGNPYGLGLTVSTGIVSSERRAVDGAGGHQDYIQTDAAINPGNSGGALVNLDGELIGINTFIHAQGQGIGFAIPIQRAHKIARDLLDYGSVRAPWLGCDLADLSRRRGVLVHDVVPDSPCARSGVEPGDVLSKIDGRPVASRSDVNAWLAPLKPGAPITLGVLRGGKPLNYAVASVELPKDLPAKILAEVVGIEVAATKEGALVVTAASEGGTWVRAQLAKGDLIVALDGVRVRTLDQLVLALSKAKARHAHAAVFDVRRPVRGYGLTGGAVPVEI